MKIFNKEHFRRKLLAYLSQPVTISAVGGFVVGAVLPTYALILQGAFKFGDVGTWMGAIATFMAVRVSLYLANRKDIPDLRWFDEAQGWDPLNQNVELVNYGRGDTVIKVSASVKGDMDDYLPGNGMPKNLADWLIAKYHIGTELLNIINCNGKIVKPTDRIKIESQGRLVLSLKASQALKEATKRMFELANNDEANVLPVTVTVEDSAHNIIQKTVIIPYQF